MQRMKGVCLEGLWRESSAKSEKSALTRLYCRCVCGLEGRVYVLYVLYVVGKPLYIHSYVGAGFFYRLFHHPIYSNPPFPSLPFPSFPPNPPPFSTTISHSSPARFPSIAAPPSPFALVTVLLRTSPAPFPPLRPKQGSSWFYGS